MILCYRADAGRLVTVPPEDLESALWVDLVHPEEGELEEVSSRLGMRLPTREAMEEIEASSRLFQEAGAAFMTALLPSRVDQERPLMSPVSFVLAGPRLVTLRHSEPRAFESFPRHASRTGQDLRDGGGVLLGLLEAIVDRLADILEMAGRDVDRISRQVFERPQEVETRDFRALLGEIGHTGDFTTNVRDSLVTLERLLGFLRVAPEDWRRDGERSRRLKTLTRDARSLSDHAGFLSSKIGFLLDATLGMISIEQNAIVKILSVAAVIFLPPTLIASVYGMNFEHMPELHWTVGYPLALGLMVASAVGTYGLFRRRGWL